MDENEIFDKINEVDLKKTMEYAVCIAQRLCG